MFKRIFAPGFNSFSANVALLVLRVWIGVQMASLHGFDKLTHFDKYSSQFVNFAGIGVAASLSLSIFAEFFCSLLLILGLLTRFAAIVLVINMSVAFTMVHRGALSGAHSGELPFIYLLIYLTILIGGPGKFSADKFLFAKRAA